MLERKRHFFKLQYVQFFSTAMLTKMTVNLLKKASVIIIKMCNNKGMGLVVTYKHSSWDGEKKM